MQVDKKDMSRKGEQGESKYFVLAQSIEMLILFFLLLSRPIVI